MNPEEDQAGYGRMFGDLVALEQRRKWLLDRATGSLSPGGTRPPYPRLRYRATLVAGLLSPAMTARTGVPGVLGRSWPITRETLPDVLTQIARRLNLWSE
jgi:hypothetical protein